jgi:hypothetical protein
MAPDRHRIQFRLDQPPSFLTFSPQTGATTNQPRGIFDASAPDSPGDEGYDILSKPSAFSLHQIRHIDELGTRRFVRAPEPFRSTVITEVHESFLSNDFASG